MYNFQAEPDLGLKVAIRRIGCACNACVAQLMKPWKPGVKAEDQERFKTSTSCKYYDLFKLPGENPKT